MRTRNKGHTVHLSKPDSQGPVPVSVRIVKEIHRSTASTLFEVEIDGERRAMKLVSGRNHS